MTPISCPNYPLCFSSMSIQNFQQFQFSASFASDSVIVWPSRIETRICVEKFKFHTNSPSGPSFTLLIHWLPNS